MSPKPTKWTKERVNEELKAILRIVETKEDCYTLQGALVYTPFTKDKLIYWQKLYKSNNAVLQPLKKAKSILEARLCNAGLRNKVNNAMAIFILKNHYGYTDKREIEQTTTHKGSVILLPKPFTPKRISPVKTIDSNSSR